MHHNQGWNLILGVFPVRELNPQQTHKIWYMGQCFNQLSHLARAYNQCFELVIYIVCLISFSSFSGVLRGVPGEGTIYRKSWGQATVLVWVWGLGCTGTSLVGQLEGLDCAPACAIKVEGSATRDALSISDRDFLEQ